MATRIEVARPDAKAEMLLDWMYRLQREEGAPDLKVLVFTEFVPTQTMLREFLTERGFPVVCLNGSMDLDERQRVQEAFAKDARILISTDAGGEGLNLQFCHVVINYDIPWNPMRIEQRIGPEGPALDVLARSKPGGGQPAANGQAILLPQLPAGLAAERPVTPQPISHSPR